ncbi:urea ABC transporter substrate-binding protein [Methylomonas rapida]|uniref:Urea ABC transporter substrate-binding protein n=1 Tax=Methylomonas rapida TaxID=2963939 RepID=A0ABY7GPT9_9GAMM|nr:urea ABC transporter substrate-binding protein [Methylomonas rapida]WAR46520.1 urea ABC transporter substrate-binding protein [Methylomonas rapida]
MAMQNEHKISRRYLMFGFWLLAAGLISCQPAQPPSIRIGVIHSLTGNMAISETPLVDAVRLAVEEINAAGGLLGRPVEMVVADSRSSPEIAAEEAERLIQEQHVSALFACWTSACRIALKPVVEKHRHLLFYPVQYEGLEESTNIIYTGSAPNQQIVPGIYWALQHLGKRLYLIGSDYVFPRVANLIITDLAKASGAEILAERYQPLGNTDFSQEIQEIQRLRPDVVINTVNGDSNLHLFSAMRDAGLSDQAIVSFSVAEGELNAQPEVHLNAHYAVWSYFQSVDSDSNRRFVQAYQQRYGSDRPTSDPVEAAYTGVKLWAQAVKEVGCDDVEQVNFAIVRQSIEAPSGILAVDPGTRHLWKNVKIGKANAHGNFDIIYDSKNALRPVPYPLYRSRREWRELAKQLRKSP